jgi:hypothetical protein
MRFLGLLAEEKTTYEFPSGLVEEVVRQRFSELMAPCRRHRRRCGSVSMCCRGSPFIGGHFAGKQSLACTLVSLRLWNLRQNHGF